MTTPTLNGQLARRNRRSSNHFGHPSHRCVDHSHHHQSLPTLPDHPSLPHPAQTRMPMNREVIETLITTFSSACVAATIAFLSGLAAYTFHNKIREQLIRRGLIAPPIIFQQYVEPRDGTVLWVHVDPYQNPQNVPGADTHADKHHYRQPAVLPRLPMARVPEPGTNPNADLQRHLWIEDVPVRREHAATWDIPPDTRPHRLPMDGTIWNPHPQYILDWDRPVAEEQQPVDAPPAYARRPEARETVLAGAPRRLCRTVQVPFPQTSIDAPLASSSNSEPDLLPHDIPDEIRNTPDVPEDIRIHDDTEGETSRQRLQLEHRGAEDPFNADSPDFEWPELANVNIHILGRARATAWELRRADIVARATKHEPAPHEPMALYLALK